tara:strand:- start:1259 stop:1498 length:240 start_codon:yes stop_codon:yes gene_type:complete
MPNNPVRDSYNPKGTLDTDFETFRFSEIPEGQLFWRYNDNRGNNYAFRKLNDKQVDNALQTKAQLVVTIKNNDIVYQKN